MVNSKATLLIGAIACATAVSGQDLGDILNDIGSDVGAIATAAVGDVKSWVQIGESYAGDGIKTAVNAAESGWKDAQSAIDKAKTAGGYVRSEAQAKASEALQEGEDAIKTAVQEASKLRGDAKSVAPSVQSKINSLINEGESKVANAQNEAASAIRDGIVTSGASGAKATSAKATGSGSGSASGSSRTTSASATSSSAAAAQQGIQMASFVLPAALLPFMAAL